MKRFLKVARWLSIPTAILWIAFLVLYPLLTDKYSSESWHHIVQESVAGVLLLMIALTCIWCSDHFALLLLKLLTFLPVPKIGLGARTFVDCLFCAAGWLILLIPVFLVALALWLGSS